MSQSPGVGKQPPVLDVPVSLCFEFGEAIKPLRCERSKLPGPGLHRAVGNKGQVEEKTTANPNSHGHGVGDTRDSGPLARKQILMRKEVSGAG